MFHLPIGELVSQAVTWLLGHYAWFFDGFSAVLGMIIQTLKQSLIGLPWWVIIILLMLAAWRASGWRLALGAGLGLLLIYDMQLWAAFVDTTVLVIISTLAAIGIGIPLGIITVSFPKMHRIIEPVLAFMQTMPSFVYLIPALMFFGLGIVPAAFATVVFAMPPSIRLTRLGIQQVDPDLVEVGRSFGTNAFQLLWKIQLPLALPTVMAGINQTMMLSLSMVVIAAMIGAGGFGQGVLAGISQMDIGKGFENGLAVVILAMILERISSGMFQRSQDRSRKSRADAKKTARRKKYVWIATACILTLIFSAGYFVQENKAGNRKEPSGTVRIGYVNWQEDVAITYLWKAMLEEKGYTVQLKSLDVAPLYVGLSQGSLDLFLDGWLPITQKAYWEKYKEQLDDYGSWYRGEAKIGLVVPEYVSIDSISQLPEEREKFNGKIIGIDPGAGIMKAASQAVQDYRLDFEVMQGSESAMIAALEKAHRDKKWVVVTGWSPHWIFAKYDLKYLSDEKKSFGSSEGLHLLAHKGFGQKYSDIAAMLKKFKMDDKQIGGLEDMLRQEADPEAAVKVWMQQNRALVAGWMK